jgi:hypothetical protein
LNGFNPNPITIHTIDPTHITRLKPKPNTCSIIGYHSPLFEDLLSSTSAEAEAKLHSALTPSFGFPALYQRHAKKAK